MAGRAGRARVVAVAVVAALISSGCAWIVRAQQEGGVQEPGGADSAAVSADGRFVAFYTPAALEPGDTNGVADIYVRDRQTLATTRASVGAGGEPADSGSGSPSISNDGRYVAFASSATNLVADDTNDQADIFVRDRRDGVTVRASVSSSGEQGNGGVGDPDLSGTGSQVAFGSTSTNLVADDENDQSDVFVRDLTAATTTLASAAFDSGFADGPSSEAAISSNGRFVAFTSTGTNVVAGDGNGVADVFVRDLQTQSTARVGPSAPQPNGPSSHPAISSNGRYIAFEAAATNLVAGDTNGAADVFVHDSTTLVTTRVSVATSGAQANGASTDPAMSADGRYVAFTTAATNLAGDVNGVTDIYTRDRTANTTAWTSLGACGTSPNGANARPAVSDSGVFVAWDTAAWNIVINAGDTNGPELDVVVRDRTDNSACASPQLVSRTSQEPNAGSAYGGLSGDGRYLAFYSEATNLVPNDTNGWGDIFVRDQATGAVELVSVASDGTQSNSLTSGPRLSADGRFVVFDSFATNLVAGDTNDRLDVFVHDRQTGTTERVDVATGGAQSPEGGGSGVLSADGRYVAFESLSSTLVTGDTNGFGDIFVRDRQTGTTSRVNVATSGAEANADSYWPALSGDGRYVAFETQASNLVTDGADTFKSDVLVRDRTAGTTELISVGLDDRWANRPQISGNGNVVAFDVGPSGTSRYRAAYARDRAAATTELLSPLGSSTVSSFPGGISDDGRYVAFDSTAADVVPGDTNGVGDVFVHDRVMHYSTRVSTSLLLGQANGASHLRYGSISGDGRYVAFSSNATNLSTTVDTNGVSDVFVRANPVPQILPYLFPPQLPRGSSITVTLTGADFRPNAQVLLSGSGVFVSQVTVVNETRIDVVLVANIAAAVGPRVIYVADPGTGPGTSAGAMASCSLCLTVV